MEEYRRLAGESSIKRVMYRKEEVNKPKATTL